MIFHCLASQVEAQTLTTGTRGPEPASLRAVWAHGPGLPVSGLDGSRSTFPLDPSGSSPEQMGLCVGPGEALSLGSGSVYHQDQDYRIMEQGVAALGPSQNGLNPGFLFQEAVSSWLGAHGPGLLGQSKGCGCDDVPGPPSERHGSRRPPISTHTASSTLPTGTLGTTVQGSGAYRGQRCSALQLDWAQVVSWALSRDSAGPGRAWCPAGSQLRCP